MPRQLESNTPPPEPLEPAGAGTERTSRRRVLKILASGAVAASAIDTLRQDLAGASPDPVESSQQTPGYLIGTLEEVPRGSVVKASYRGQPMIVVNLDDEIHVLSAICLHEGCIVDWNRDLDILQCPCHDGRFDKAGKVLSGPPPAPLVPFEARVLEGKIFIVER